MVVIGWGCLWIDIWNRVKYIILLVLCCFRCEYRCKYCVVDIGLYVYVYGFWSGDGDDVREVVVG